MRRLREKEAEDEKEKDITIADSPPKDDDKKKRSIYRYGYIEKGLECFVPTDNDVDTNTGLSFFINRPKPGSAVTTMEKLNTSGYFIAVNDRGQHVTVKPIGCTLKEWQDGGIKSMWTLKLSEICTLGG